MKSKKIFLSVICGTLLSSSLLVVAPKYSSANEHNNKVSSFHFENSTKRNLMCSGTDISTITNNQSFSKQKINSSLESLLVEDNVTPQQWNEYTNSIKSNATSTERWKGAAIKKAMKFAVKHVDLIPSKKLRDIVKKYSGKIINAIDTIDAYTWYGIANALIKCGVPEKYADLIADFLVTFLL